MSTNAFAPGSAQPVRRQRWTCVECGLSVGSGRAAARHIADAHSPPELRLLGYGNLTLDARDRLRRDGVALSEVDARSLLAEAERVWPSRVQRFREELLRYRSNAGGARLPF